METALSTIRLLPFSKQQVMVFADQIKNELLSGNVDPLELAVYFKALEKTMEAVKDTLSELALKEAEKNGKSFEYKGAKIELAELATRYDYSQTGDDEWFRYDCEVNAATERRKEREATLKTLKEAAIWVNPDTGEAQTIYPPIKSSKSGIKITIK